jgi:translocation and assembly module TamA
LGAALRIAPGAEGCDTVNNIEPEIDLSRLARATLSRLSLVAVFALSGPQAGALETISFNTPGASKDLRAALQGASLLLTAQAEKRTDPQDIFAAARAEYGRLLGALYAEGHYSGTIRVLVDGQEAASIPPLDAPTRIDQIEVQVDPGPQFLFSTAAIDPVADRSKLPPAFAFGQVARSGAVRDAAAVAVLTWRDAGHAKAQVAGQAITADHRTQRLSAAITLDPGPRLRFGRLTVQGADRMRPDRILAIAGLPEGQVFSPAEVDRAADRLRRSGVFQSVALTEADRVRAPDLLDIDATVVEDRLHRYSVGAELATEEGFALTGYWLHRNLLGGAERLRVDSAITNIGADTSGVDYSLGVTLDRPATFTADTTLSLSAKIGHVADVREDYDSAALSAGVSHVFSNKLSGSLALAYEFSKGNDARQTFLYRNLSLPLGATWDNRDSSTDATKGVYIDAEVKPFYGLGTTDSGVRLKMDARGYRGFGAGRFVLAGRVQAGAIYGAGLLQTPRDFLFYSGGGGTVRGQPYQSLGVNALRSLTDDYRTGGSFFLGTSVEARVKVSRKIGVVGFFDVGRIGLDSLTDDAGGWHSGAGLGLRYDTTVGPIRLDVAAPVGGTTGDGVQLYVGLGQAF